MSFFQNDFFSGLREQNLIFLPEIRDGLCQWLNTSVCLVQLLHQPLLRWTQLQWQDSGNLHYISSQSSPICQISSREYSHLMEHLKINTSPFLLMLLNLDHWVHYVEWKFSRARIVQPLPSSNYKKSLEKCITSTFQESPLQSYFETDLATNCNRSSRIILRILRMTSSNTIW